MPTRHELWNTDARELSFLKEGTINLIVTSPPYWTLKQYNDHEDQMGHIQDYREFLKELTKVWKHALRVLVPGGRLICVVGDVCLSRKANGRHTVIPLHASIQEICVKIGFDNLTPILWHKIANAHYEAKGNGGGFFGKPYEPNGVIKNDVEYILMFRKLGGYRSPTLAERILSLISKQNYREWFTPIWYGVTGASTRAHPAPYPVELAERLIRMFSFAGDVVLDPFSGTATTSIAASRCARNSIGVELDHEYFELGSKRLHQATSSLFSNCVIVTGIK